MIGFDRTGDGLVAEWEEVEVALVTSLVAQVEELLGGAGDAPGAEGFPAWEREFGGGVRLDADDPVIRRLFPDAYPDDPVASAEHRRFSQDALRRGRVTDGRVVLEDLARTGGGERPLVVSDEHVGPWVRSLTGVRLSLAVRLGIETESDHAELERLGVRDPRTQIVAIYDWLGVVIEAMLDADDSSAS